MPTSQFKIYSSTDVGSPVVNGLTGSLISLLDACLINGYGTGSNYKAPVGWKQPLSTLSGSIACYQQPSGSGFTLLVNDTSPTTAKEAWVSGWESLYELTSSVTGPFSGSIGTGLNQFPETSQESYGRLVIRKSNTADSTAREWILFADAYTFYMFIRTGDFTELAYSFYFGDIFSLYGARDKYRCLLAGRRRDNTTAILGTTDGVKSEWAESFSFVFTYVSTGTTMAHQQSQPGLYLAGSWLVNSSQGISIAASKTWDFARSSIITIGGNLNAQGYSINGLVPFPNGPDRSVHFSPFFIWEPSSWPILRGRIRGIFQIGNSNTSFSHGQIIEGINDQAGKTFMILKYVGGTNTAVAVEISNTVETN